MAGNEADTRGKGHWPDMRSLGWPPDGVETTAKAKAPGAGVVDSPIQPFELAADPGGKGGLVVVPVPESPTRNDYPPAQDDLESRSVNGIASASGGCQAMAILQEVRALRLSVESLTATVKALTLPAEARAGEMRAGETRASLRNISDLTARQEIQEYFMHHQGKTIFPAEIAEALHLPVLKVA